MNRAEFRERLEAVSKEIEVAQENLNKFKEQQRARKVPGIKYPLVFVRWADSYGCGNAWSEIPDATPHTHNCISVGWMARHSDDYIVLVPHISPANEKIGAVENGCGDMTIPRAAIIDFASLSVEPETRT